MAPLLLLLPVLLLMPAADAVPASCSKATCAGQDVHYPFWFNSSSGSNCGYPGLGLACEDNTSLILSVQSHRYRVYGIDYTSNIVTVIDADPKLDEHGPGCPRLHWNLTIDYSNSWLQLTPSDSNITFLYNCKKNISSWPTGAFELPGCGGYDKRSYVLPDVVSGTEAYEYECEEVVVAPVLSAHKAGVMGGAPGGSPPLVNGSSYGDMVKAGFEFIYHPNSRDCDRCEHSGGWCGYRRNERNGVEVAVFTCFCNDGPTSGRCDTPCIQAS